MYSFRAPEPLPILNPSNFVPKNGFPVVKGLIPLSWDASPRNTSIDAYHDRGINPFTAGNPFWGTNLLAFSIGRGSGALKGLTGGPTIEVLRGIWAKGTCYDRYVKKKVYRFLAETGSFLNDGAPPDSPKTSGIVAKKKIAFDVSGP